jgi:hypothetical protein
MTIAICDAYGKIRSDFSESEIDSLTDEQRAALAAVIKTARGEEAAEANEREVLQDTYRLVQAVADAEQALRDALGKVDPVTEIKKAIEQQRRVAQGLEPLPPIEVKGSAKLETAVRKAHTQLEASRERSNKAKIDLRDKRAKLAEAILAWQTANPPLRTEDHIREHLKRTADYNAKIASGEIEAPPEQTFVPLSHLDNIMNSRGSNGSVNVGFGRRHAARGLRPVKTR